MRTPIRLRGRTRFPSPLVAVALAASLLGPLGAAAPAVASPARQAAAPATAPAAPVTGTACSPGCDLYAIAGTMPAASLPGATSPVPVWGYNTTNAAVTAPGGPTLVVTEGTDVAITLHNVNLPTATSLMIAGQPGVPDTTGVTAGNSTTYSFPATGPSARPLKPGTYLYEAGLTADGPRQVAMGLYGALVVRPAGAPLQAYAAPSTAFADEAVLVLSEIDPAFSAAPTAFDLTDFAPKYWLINGKVYPNTESIGTAGGNKVLLRYVNAGLQTHSMSLLGLHQTIIATDGQPAVNQSTVVAETVPTGGTLDTIVTIPPTPPAGTKYAVFDAAMHLDNTGASTGGVIDFGGMLTFLAITGSTTGGGGPVTSGVTLSPNPSNGSAPVTLSASIAPSTGATLTDAEYFVDTLGTNGAGCHFTANTNVTIPVSGAVAPCVDLTTLSSSNHTFYVHGQDSSGTPGPTWGAFGSAVLNLDKTGPAISNMGLTPSSTNGTVNVALQATASDVASGNQNVTAAEYFIDSQPANTVRGTAFTVALPATSVSLAATIPAATVLALSDGNHTVAVRAQDALGNWGPFGTVTLKVDKTGPGTSGVSAIPNPNNGTLGVQIGTGLGFYVRIDATVADPVPSGPGIPNGATIIAVSPGISFTISAPATASGVGVLVTRTDTTATFTSGSKIVNDTAAKATDVGSVVTGTSGSPIPSGTTITAVSAGASITMSAAATSSGTGVAVTRTDTGASFTSGSTVVMDPAAKSTDVGSAVSNLPSNIVAAEYFFDTVGASGTGGAMIATDGVYSGWTEHVYAAVDLIHISALSQGTHTIYVHGKDAAGNWGPTATTPFIVDKTRPAISALSTTPSPANLATNITLSITAADPANAGTPANGPASNLTGGEYFWGTTDPGAGNGTSFTFGAPSPSGTFNVAIDVSARTIFTNNTLSVRVKDAAGNWSTVSATPIAIDRIFANSFPNSAAPYGWSATGGTAARLSLNAANNMKDAGTNSLRANVTAGTSGYVTNTLAAGQTSYRARFYINPHAAPLGNNTPTIFAARSGNSTVFAVEMRLSGGNYQVRAVGNTNSAWITITGATAIEVARSGGSLTLSAYVLPTTVVVTVPVSTTSINAARLGLSAGVNGQSNGSQIYFDGFVSSRTTPIGP